MKISELFETIRTTSGAADKSAVMQENLNDTVKQIFEDTYSDRKYFVKKFDMPTAFGTKTLEKNYSEFHKMLDVLASRTITGNDAIALVEGKIGEFVEEDAEILARIMDRNLKIGLSKDSFNKIIGEAAPKKFEVTLAVNLDKAKGVNPLDGTWWASRKCDGCVSGDTLVEFENGIKLPIETVVANRMKGKVKSYDETTGKIVYCDIEDWMHNVEDVNPSQKQWYQIELANGKILKITGNDSLYVKGKGWIKVENLSENDEIICDATVFTKIKTIVKIASEDTYELTIADTHCFFCNGILKHNCRAIGMCKKANGKVDITFLSRGNKEFTTLDNVKPALAWYLRDLPDGDYVTDGELCKVDENGDEDFQSIMKEIKRKDYTIKDPCYQMFDFCTLEEFEGKKKSVNFTGRYAQMQKMMQGNKFHEIKLLKQELIKTQEDFDRWTKYVEDGNWEGFMLRKDIPFETGRSKNLLKVKKFMDDDFVVKDLECAEMTTAEPGIGNVTFYGCKAILIEYKGNTVRVGSGLTKEQRIAWAKNPDLIIGKTVTVQYFETTKNQNGTYSLRFPILKWVYEGKRDC